jgi:hypothetical protein
VSTVWTPGSPCSACNTITVADTFAGTLGLPRPTGTELANLSIPGAAALILRWQREHTAGLEQMSRDRFGIK